MDAAIDQTNKTKVLAKGVVHFPGRLDVEQQVELARCAVQLGVLDDRERCKNEKAHNVHMMCIGREWDSKAKTHTTKTPIPPLVLDIARKALDEAMALTDVGATYCADQCMVNYYPPNARLGLHDEREADGAVVSISLGDTGDFVFKRSWSNKVKLRTVPLASGDILVFGGAARSIVHGVPLIHPDTGPGQVRAAFIGKEGIGGRVNFNLRER